METNEVDKNKFIIQGSIIIIQGLLFSFEVSGILLLPSMEI